MNGADFTSGVRQAKFGCFRAEREHGGGSLDHGGMVARVLLMGGAGRQTAREILRLRGGRVREQDARKEAATPLRMTRLMKQNLKGAPSVPLLVIGCAWGE